MIDQNEFCIIKGKLNNVFTELEPISHRLIITVLKKAGGLKIVA